MSHEIYDEQRRAITDVLDAREIARGQQSRNTDGKWPAWIQTALAVGAVVVSLAMAWSALDKRISLLEQKIDFIGQELGKR